MTNISRLNFQTVEQTKGNCVSKSINFLEQFQYWMLIFQGVPTFHIIYPRYQQKFFSWPCLANKAQRCQENKSNNNQPQIPRYCSSSQQHKHRYILDHWYSSLCNRIVRLKSTPGYYSKDECGRWGQKKLS